MISAACAGTLDNAQEYTDLTSGDSSAPVSATSASGGNNGSAASGGNKGGSGVVSNGSCPDVPSTVFQVKCATSGCHTTADMMQSAEGLDLSSSSSLASLVGKKSMEASFDLIDPSGDPMKSMIYLKIADSTPPGGGSQMPVGTLLDSATIACVGQWIMTEASGGGATGPVDGGGPDERTSMSVDSGSVQPVFDSGPAVDASRAADSGSTTTMDSGAADAGSRVTFTQLYSGVIKPVCLPCHSTGTGKTTGKLDMSTQATAYMNLVGVAASGSGCSGKGTRVVAGSSATSLLYELLQTTVPCGSRMPRTGSLTNAQIAEVASWIDAGALNN